MTHIVLGYPDFDTSFRIVEAMAEGGVELIELQIPFSEPIADGPVIVHANQEALRRGATVERCFALAGELAQRFAIPLLFMSYYNVLFKHGVERFVTRMAEVNVKGAIIPDLPPAEGAVYLQAMSNAALDPIFICAPNTPPERLAQLTAHGRGFMYCAARTGVTGSPTELSSRLTAYLARVRAGALLPLAVGFGVRDSADIDFLRGKADIAVLGSEPLRVLERGGVPALRLFLANLR